MLEGRVSRIQWLPDSLSFLQGRGLRPSNGVVRFVEQLRGTTDLDYQAFVTKVLDDSATRIVLAYWGTIPLADLAAIKTSRPQVKLVLMVLCYPLALTRLGISRQNFYMRRTARYLDGFLFPSEEMSSYFQDRVFDRHAAPPSVVIPPCWPAGFLAAERSRETKSDSNLVYVGRTDLAGKTVHAGDDIRLTMREILQAGIELHHVYSPETDDGHPRRRLFHPLPLIRLIEFMGSFDASLIAYNTDACVRDDRFRLTVPDRLITSVSAGIPIAVPKQGYSGVKSYLRDYPAVIEFESPRVLAETLSQRQRVSGLRETSWTARENYTAKHHGPALQEFLAQLI